MTEREGGREGEREGGNYHRNKRTGRRGRDEGGRKSAGNVRGGYW